MGKIRILLAFNLASMAVIAAFSREGGLTPANSTDPFTPAISAQHLTTSRQICNDGAKRLEFRVGGSIDPLDLDKSHTRRHHGKQMMNLWARQNSTPSTDLSVSLTTATITRTAVVEVASKTQVLISTLVQTLTFVNPIWVTKTSTITIFQPSSSVAKRYAAALVASSDHGATLPASASPAPTAASVIVSQTAVRRQMSNKPVTVMGSSLVITIETTVTLTRTGSFISTATIFKPIFVSITATPTVTKTWFVTTIVPIQASTSSSQVTSTSSRVFPTSTVISPTTPAAVPARTSSSPSQSLGTSTVNLMTSSATSSSIDPTIGVTTWFSWQSEDSTFSTTHLASTTTQIITDSKSPPTTLSPSLGASSEPALGPAEIAGITMGASAAVFLFLLALWLFRRRFKRRQHVHIPEDDYQMTSATAAAAIIDSASSNHAMPHDRSAALASEASGNSSHRDEIRVAIQNTANRRAQSSGVFPVTKTWPRPPGYTGETYSFSADESGQSTPREPKTWSNASEYGGSSSQGLPGSGAVKSAAAHSEPRNGTPGAGRNRSR